MSAGVACLCVNDALGKALGESYPVIQVLFLRNLIAFPIICLLLLKLGGRPAFRSHRPVAHVARAALWLGAAMMFFSSFQYLGLAEATALAFIAPILLTALSALVLKEHVGWRRWSAVLVGFVGVLIVVRPGTSTFQTAALLPIATAFFYAVLMISARWVDPRESMWTLMLYQVGIAMILSAMIVPFIWVDVRSEHIGLFLAIAFFGTAGMTLITQAFRFASASLLAPFDYAALVWATLFGWFFWGELPDLVTYLGSAVIVASGLFIIFREHQLEN